MTTNAYAWLQTQLYVLGSKIEESANDEGGMQVAEAVAMVAVILALLGAVAAVFKGDSQVGNAAVSTISGWISKLGGG